MTISNPNLNPNIYFPPPRASLGMVLFGDPSIYIMIIGGYNSTPVYQDSNVFNIQNVHDDYWVLSTYSWIWYRIYPNSLTNPMRRYGLVANVK